tara:strand:+ start:1236 stop:1835 length:600 start_codon:yes stop_codon:yes gene_type:complete
MTNCCGKQRRRNFYAGEKPHKCVKFGKYGIGGVLLSLILFWILRDTTPVMFVEPSSTDMQLDRGDIVNSDKINDVYWRVSVRHVSSMLSEICKEKGYSVLTHKNVLMDGARMKESYIYLCGPSHKPVVNARAVVSKSATESVRCVERYANVTKTVVRKYPFSLKYVCGETFVSKTQIIREPIQACTWLHAIDIVESVWD